VTEVRIRRDGDPSDAGAALAIGTFDGVHVGHRSLIEGTVEAASTRGLSSGIVTWDRHPLQTIREDDVPPLLTGTDRKIELLKATGIGFTTVIGFDDAFAAWSPERFVTEVLVGELRARHVRVGHDWRFGHKAAGDVELLAKLGAEHGFEVEGVSLVEAEGDVVSSTRVRKVVADGDMDLARRLLTRPFDVDGIVVRGDGRGASLGFPTANLDIDPALVRPARGVYAGRARVEDVWHRAAINVGMNPTFGGETMRVEAYLLDFDMDIYDVTLRVEFWERLRDELKFDAVDALLDQMADDVRRTREIVPTTIS
jgi:riboflavin kinase/FMN adenylyltransferase